MANADRLIEVFNEAKARPAGAERERFLAEACSGEPELKEQVVSLLQAHEGAGDFLKKTLVVCPTALVTEKPGDTIGRYKLLQVIGEGGCGVVYMAEQTEPVRRKVALKVIKLGMDTKSVIARFEAERQALALMDHPNIAQVFDAGATDLGRPYFVMELVRGIKITDYCDQQQLSTAERLDLFIQVCQAIQHAHQKGIIHRDIKPSNILVAQHDTLAVPKVIDFGIAKATSDQRLTDKTLFTAFEQFMGTPAYMSSEQAQWSGLDIDTRSDIYSLGVLLYELLTGQTPFDAEHLLRSGLDEMRRIIREEEPPRPSTRLGTLDLAEATELSRKRQMKIPELAHGLRGDLDWIVMKCLEKDRTRRYETANGLAADLQRHLANEPVLARPPSTAYRFQKAFRRNKLAFSAVAAVAVVLIVGVVVSTWQAIEASRARNSEKEQRLTAQTERDKARTAQKEAEEAGVATGKALAAESQQRKLTEEARVAMEKALAAESEQRKLTEYESYVAKVALAAMKIDNREFASAEELLDSCPPEYRHWEWGRLKRLGHADLFTFGGGTRVFLSPDGRQVLTVTDGGGKLIEVWDPVTGGRVSSYPWANASLSGAFFFGEGRPTLLLDWNLNSGRLLGRLLDLGTGKELCRLSLTNFIKVMCAALSPDGRRVLIGDQEAFAKMFDTQTGDELFTLAVVGSERPSSTGRQVWTVAFSPDGRRVLTGGEFAVQLWDAESGREVLNLPDKRLGRRAAMFSPDGKRILTCGSPHVHLWDAETGRETAVLRAHRRNVNSVAFSSNGQWVLTASEDRTARLWDALTGSNLATFRGHAGEVRVARFSLDERRVLTVGDDRTARVWDRASGTNVASLESHAGAVNSAVFSPDGRHVLTASHDRTARLWDAETGRELMTFSGHSAPVTSALFCPEGGRVVTSSEDGTAKVWSVDTANEGVLFKVPGGVLESAVFSPNGKLVLTLDAGARTTRGGYYARLWDARTGKPRHAFKHAADTLNSTAFTLDSRIVITRSRIRYWRDNLVGDQRIGLWETESGRAVTNVSAMTNDWEVMAVSPDARRVFMAKKSDASIWNVETGRKVSALQGFRFYLGGALFSPDGRRLVTRFDYGNNYDPAFAREAKQWTWNVGSSAKVWDTETGAEVCVLKEFHDASALFVQDSRRLLSFGFSSTVVWDIETGQRLGILQAGPGILSPDARRYFATTYRGEVRVLDVDASRLLVTGKGHREEALVTSLSLDGKRFLTSSVDGTAKLWDAETGRELLNFKTQIGRHAYPTFSPDNLQILLVTDGVATVLSAADWKASSKRAAQ